MLRPALVSAFFFAPLLVVAQPAPEALLKDVRFEDDVVRPAFVALTAEQVKAKVNAAMLEIDDGVMVVQAVEIELPKGDNSRYASAEFEPPVVRDARGAAVAIEQQSGSRNETRNSIQHKLLVPGGDAAAKFSTVKGRVTVRVPLTVETRTIRSGDRTALAKLGAVIDGPYVRYRRDLVAESAWDSGLDPVRAFDASGRMLEREGTYPDRVNGDGFEAKAFHGAAATVEIDVPGEFATVTLDYDLTQGNRAATKVTKSLGAAERKALAEAAAAAAPADVEGFLAAAVNGDAKAVTRFLEAGVPVDARGESGNTALHIAASLGRENVVDVLLAAGANVNAKDSNGLTPIFGLGARCERTPIVAKLIAKGADVNAKGNSPASALAIAKAMNCTEMVEVLQKAGAK